MTFEFYDLTRDEHPYEGSEDCPSSAEGFSCTRASGHAGRHKANGTSHLLAEWDDADDDGWYLGDDE